jgi:type IV pilus assembly protein PilO
MAAPGFMADFAKMPTQRKALVFVVGGLMIGALYYQFGYKSLKNRLDEADGLHASLVSQNKKLADDLPKFEKLKARDQELKKIIDENQKALPTEAELPAFFETLSRKVNEAGVRVTKWNYRKEESVDSFVKVPVEIEMTGTFLQIKQFFASLIQKDIGPVQPTGVSDSQIQERERIVSIEALSLLNPTVRNREIILNARFIAATFRQEAQVAAPGTPGAPGAPGELPPGVQVPPGVGLPPPSGGLPPPPPSAATPAGAKARTEDALKKGDVRNSNATGVDEAKTPAGGGVDRLKKGM